MDPLTIGFENALHEANSAAPPAEASSLTNLVLALQAVIDASPHRARRPVTVTAIGGHRVELRRGEATYQIDKSSGRWRLVGSHGSACSGPLAAALTEWLTA